MAWSENIHIHLHNDDQREIVKLLKEIKELLTVNNEDQLRQEIYNKITKLIVDVKSTV